ncbi:hypothetical protein [uncultured Aquimarina sp.]|uniref:hypothetical protein n=1 Tax=uncultured Aquimarina sp. TaxID=575652 RepID=UPI0026396367|nr:hypothetical protein [uncultured Aquimarina sp.]
MNKKIKYNILIKPIILGVFILLITVSCGPESIEYKFNPYQKPAAQKTTLERVDFFMETSASMKGYVNTQTAGNYPLKEVIPFLLTDLNKIYPDSVQLYTVTNKPNLYTRGIQKFEDQLGRGAILGGRSSKLQNVFSHLIDAVTENSVSILVSDCIPDLGSDDTKANSSKITTKIYKHLITKENMGVAVFQYLSDFNGTYYYDRLNTGSNNPRRRPYYDTILKNRPFYIWIFGHQQAVKELVSKDFFDNYQQSHFYNIPMKDMSYELLDGPNKGKVSIDSENNLLRIKEVSKKRPVQFTIGIDLNNQSKGVQKQFMNPKNYTIEPEFLKETTSIEIVDKSILSKKGVPKNIIEEKKLTHFLQPTFHDLDQDSEKISITLYNKTPIWIQQANLTDDLNITADSLEYKTFGFNAITKAFDRAFKGKNDTLADFTFTKKHQ